MLFLLMHGLITVMAFVVFGIVFFRIISTWRKNERSPRLTVAATVVAKRGHTSRDSYCRTCEVQPSQVSTSYYVTFQFDSGDRLELHVPSHEYGYLIEGDRGMLTFQGTRFRGFQRT